jgi:HAMP domain-containing protein
MNEMDFLYWLWKRGLMQTIPITELDNLADEYKQDKPAEETPDAQTEFERTNACYGNHTGD